MVKIMENPTIQWMIWGEKNSIFGNIHLESHMVEGLAKVYIAKHFWQD